MRARNKLNKIDGENQYRDNNYLIANLEDKKKEFEEANENLRKENVDLGGFGQDGLIIKKNMQKLKEETDRIKS
jgi:hypothetical protein